MSTHHRLIIIGSGPAGLTAGIYAGRARLQPLILEGKNPGGQLMGTNDIQNWPGIPSMSGPELMEHLCTHATSVGAVCRQKTVASVDLSQKPFALTLTDNTAVTADSIILATGATHRRLYCPGEDTYWGRGVSTCATCDAPLYDGKEVVIVGGGNTAVTNALQLAKYAQRVTIVQQGAALTATDPIVEQVYTHERISIIYDHTVTAVHGDETRVTGVTITGKDTTNLSSSLVEDPAERQLPTDGVFIAIGMGPNTDLVKGQVAMNDWGHIVREEGTTKTSIPGFFAAGDVADYRYRQAITSAGEGCRAALDAEYYLNGKVMVVYT
jgi:thioredoxin reductase (NADPH)